MTDVTVLHLADGQLVDLDTHLAGSWGSTAVVELQPGATRALGDDHTETCLFLIEGTARLTLDGEPRDVVPGTGITLVMGTRALLTAIDRVRLFIATVNVQHQHATQVRGRALS